MTFSTIAGMRAGWRGLLATSAILGTSLVGVRLGATQTPVRDKPAATADVPRGTASLGGTVVDADHRPIRRVEVTVDGDMHLSRTAVTDETGRFLFRDLPPGRFTIRAEKGGYPFMSYGARAANRTGPGLLLADGQAATDLVLTLAPGAVVTGTVYDTQGQPMPDVPVQAWLVRTSLTGERSLQAASPQDITSDERGIYRIFDLPPGEYTVGTSWAYGTDAIRVPTDDEIREAFAAAARASSPSAAASTPPPPPKPPRQPPRFGYAQTYAPGTVDGLAATTYALRAGEVQDNVDIHMQFLPMSRIEGSVTGLDGNPVSMASIVLFRHNKVGPRFTTFFSADTTGHFTTASLVPGNYSVMAQTNGPVSGPGAKTDAPKLFALADVTISTAEPAEIALRLQPAMTMTGRIVFRPSAGPPMDPQKVRLNLFPLEGTNATPNAVVTTIEPSGQFVTTGLTPGRFVVMASVVGAPGWAPDTLTVGGQEVLDLPIDIGTVDPPELVVTFSNQPTTLQGLVTAPEGQHASDYFVVALPADQAYWTPQSRRIQSARPGLDGRYRFSGLPPGQYVVAATTDLTGGDLQDLGALSQLATHGVPVTLGSGESKSIDLKLGGGLHP